MNARSLHTALVRERALIDPDREVCGECAGSGDSDYGPCPGCDGYGSWLKSDLDPWAARKRDQPGVDALLQEIITRKAAA